MKSKAGIFYMRWYAIGSSSKLQIAICNFQFAIFFSALASVLANASPPAPATAPSHPASAAFRFIAPVLTHQDSLFIVASTGEPRFKAKRDSAEAGLIAGDTATLDYLVANRMGGQTARQRHYVENLFKAISDSGRNHAPVTRIATALSGAADTIKVQLLHIGSELGDSTFLPIARQYLRADSLEVRKTAVRCLGSYPSPANVFLLFDGLDKTKDLERQQRLWALSRQPDLKDWPRLLPLMMDSNLYNRQLVRQIVGKACGGNWPMVERYIPQTLDPRARLEWIQLALETSGIDAKAYVRKNAPLLDNYERRFIQSMY
ncbi:MAG: hypothetical protein JWP91_4357 [Fibrobacteres bacterium]|nr:hypothetical protein [Fibrobacterota bacterium]